MLAKARLWGRPLANSDTTGLGFLEGVVGVITVRPMMSGTSKRAAVVSTAAIFSTWHWTPWSDDDEAFIWLCEQWSRPIWWCLNLIWGLFRHPKPIAAHTRAPSSLSYLDDSKIHGQIRACFITMDPRLFTTPSDPFIVDALKLIEFSTNSAFLDLLYFERLLLWCVTWCSFWPSGSVYSSCSPRKAHSLTHSHDTGDVVSCQKIWIKKLKLDGKIWRNFFKKKMLPFYQKKISALFSTCRICDISAAVFTVDKILYRE